MKRTKQRVGFWSAFAGTIWAAWLVCLLGCGYFGLPTVGDLFPDPSSGGSPGPGPTPEPEPPPAPPAGNQLGNHGFEAGLAGGDWTTSGQGTFNRLFNLARSGSWSVEAVSTAATGAGTATWTSKARPVSPGFSYRASAWAKLSWADGVAVGLVFLDAAGGTVSAAQSPVLGGNREWTQIQVTASAPATAVMARVELRLIGGGKVFWDDADLSAITGTPDPTPPPPNPTPPPGPVVGRAEVRWDLPTTNQDGTPLADLAGFKVYARKLPATNPVLLSTLPTQTAFSAEGLTVGEWVFQVSAYDTVGNESALSAEARKTIQ